MYNLKINKMGVITDETFKTEKAARKAMQEQVVNPAKEYAATLPAPKLVSVKETSRSRKFIDKMEYSFLENSSCDYYFLIDKTSGENVLYMSGVISEEGRDYDREVDLVPDQYDYGQDD